MKTASLTLTKQQQIWLKDIVRSDISDWQYMASRPIDEVGAKMYHLSQIRIETMKAVLAKIEALEAVETLQRFSKSSFVSEIARCGMVVVDDVD